MDLISVQCMAMFALCPVVMHADLNLGPMSITTTPATLLGRDNLLVVKDPVRHAKLRALLQPAFSAEAIKSYLPAIQALVARHLDDWCTAGPDGIKAYPCLKMLTFDFILQVSTVLFRLGVVLSPKVMSLLPCALLTGHVLTFETRGEVGGSAN